MPTTRYLLKPECRRALELLAACPDGCTEAIMLAHGFSIDMMVELINSGLATLQTEWFWTTVTKGKERGCASLRQAVGLTETACIARSQLDFRFRGKNGHAADVAVPLTLTVSLNRTGFGLTSTGGHAPFAGIAVLAPAKLTYDH